MDKQLVIPMDENYQEYLIDESKYAGGAQSISFPEHEEEIIAIVRKMREQGTGITIQSGKTGIVGGAVPQGGHIMNLSAMNQVKEAILQADQTGLITVEPGIHLMELNKQISRLFKSKALIWPPQPTESSAAVGGILSSNAKGINQCYYGDSRQYVESIRLVLASGEVKTLTRSRDGKTMDQVLGGEGIYGVITEAVLKLIPKPEESWGITFFFETLSDIDGFVRKLKQLPEEGEAFITAAEYMDRMTLDIIEQRKHTITRIKDLPDVKARFKGMVYLELSGPEAAIEELAGVLMELAAESGSDPEEAWAVTGDGEIEKMHDFRHAAAETANLFIEERRRTESRITKLGTDMSLTDLSFLEAVQMYENSMQKAGLSGCIFGHLLGNHLHVNLLPGDYEEYQRGRELITTWMKEQAKTGNKLAAEHGLGKLKSHLADLVFSREEQAAMGKLKEQYDPEGLWNRGNIFPAGGNTVW